MSDPLDTLRELTPSAEPSPEVLERVRNDLMAHIVDHDLSTGSAPTYRSPRRNTRRWIGGIAAVVVLATAGSAWAITRRSSEGSTSVMCPGTVVIDAVSGDPVVDCADEWRRAHGEEPPPMAAFDNGIGGVEVRLRSESVPDGYSELPQGPTQDTRLIELEAAISDAGGLAAGCYDEPTGRALGEGELSRLGLSDWTVTTDDARRPDGSGLCAFLVVRPDLEQLLLIGVPMQSNPLSPFATALASELRATCLNLDDAAEVARVLADQANVTVNGNTVDLSEESGGLVIHEVVDEATGCTRSNVNVGGRVEVTLRGPR